jgi:hypothetical protein
MERPIRTLRSAAFGVRGRNPYGNGGKVLSATGTLSLERVASAVLSERKSSRFGWWRVIREPPCKPARRLCR